MKSLRTLLAALVILHSPFVLPLHAQVPQIVNYQGRVAVGATNFNGTGSFKFALVNAAGTTTFWSNNGTSVAGSQPTAAVSLTVTKGLYSVLLGDTTVPGMTLAIPASVWANADVRLRVWFNDGANGSQLVSPDQRLAPNGYHSDGSISSAALASGAVTSAKIANGAVTNTQIAAGTVIPSQTIAGTTQTAVANGRYVATSASLTTINLPTTANVGDVVEITGAGAGGWSTVPPVWTAQSGAPSASWTSVASSSDGTRLAAVVRNGQIYTSANSGVTWTAQGGAPSASWTSVASSSDGTRLAAVAYNAGIYTSANSGVTWTAQSGAPSAGWTSVASSSDGTRLAAVVYSGQIYTSANYGVTWTAQGGAPSAGWYSVASSSDGTHLAAVVYSGQIYTSANYGVTWTAQSGAPSAIWVSVASSSDGMRLAAVANYSQIYTSANFGVTWTAQSGAPSAGWTSVASSSDGTRLAAVVYGGQIYTSANSGVTWTAQGGAPSASWTSVASSSDGGRLAAVVDGGQIYTSANVITFAGAQGTTAALQYLGNGQWGAVGQTQIAAGAVSTASIAAGAVSTANIAAGAVSTGKIAAGAVGTAQLAPGAVTAANLGADVGLWSVNGANVFRSGGNVGIGKSNPNILLDVAPGGVIGNTSVVGTAVHDVANRGTKASFGYQAAGTGDFNGMQAVVNLGTAGCGNSGDLLFNTWECNTSNSREVMRINGTGNVGIGKTNPATKLDVNGEATMTACNITSDRNAKEQFKPVNARAVLDKVARLPISEWQYKEQGDARHIGPMAQDFHAAFAVGRDEKHITTVDADGVALAAIQGLNEKLEEQVRDKEQRIEELEKSVEELKALVKDLARQQNGGAR